MGTDIDDREFQTRVGEIRSRGKLDSGPIVREEEIQRQQIAATLLLAEVVRNGLQMIKDEMVARRMT
jgi:hypothetical protein